MKVNSSWSEALRTGTRVRWVDYGMRTLSEAVMLSVNGAAVCADRLIDHHFHWDGAKDVLKSEESCWIGIHLSTEVIAECSAVLVVHQSRTRPVGSSSVAKRFAEPSRL